jgi:hypothetical protein
MPKLDEVASKADALSKRFDAFMSRADADYTKLSAAQLEAAINKAQGKSSAITSKMIAAGRGRERPSEIRTMSDPLAKEYMAQADIMEALYAEKDARSIYHGSMKPIKRATTW